MNPGQVARIAHEAHRAVVKADSGVEIPQWERLSPNDRSSISSSVEMVLSGRMHASLLTGVLGSYGYIVDAVLGACMAPVFDVNEESGIEPERKPGFNPKDLEREAPAIRAAKQPGECVVQTFV